MSGKDIREQSANAGASPYHPLLEGANNLLVHGSAVLCQLSELRVSLKNLRNGRTSLSESHEQNMLQNL